jgi:hypothetical protein
MAPRDASREEGVAAAVQRARVRFALMCGCGIPRSSNGGPRSDGGRLDAAVRITTTVGQEKISSHIRFLGLEFYILGFQLIFVWTASDFVFGLWKILWDFEVYLILPFFLC